MCVNNLYKVALDSAAAGIEPATSSRKSNALTTAPPSHTTEWWWWRLCSAMLSEDAGAMDADDGSITLGSCN